MKDFFFPDSKLRAKIYEDFLPLRQRKTSKVAVPINKFYGYIINDFELE